MCRVSGSSGRCRVRGGREGAGCGVSGRNCGGRGGMRDGEGGGEGGVGVSCRVREGRASGW